MFNRTIKHSGSKSKAWAYMATSETKSVAFDDDVNADRSRRMNIFSLHSVSQHK